MNARATPPQTPAEAKIAADYVGARLTLPGGAEIGDLRDAAFDAFMAAGLPTRRVEAWHYTDLKRAMSESLPIAAPPAATSILAQGARLASLSPRIDGVEAIRVVLVDGHFIPALSDLARLPQGVTLRSLADALAQDDASLVDALAAPGLGQGDAALALNTAFMQGGFVLDIDANVDVGNPIEIVSLSSSVAAQAIYARSLVRLGAGARLTLVEVEACDNGAIEQRNCALVFQLADDAALDHVFVPGELAQGSAHVAHLLASLQARTSFNSFTLARGGGLVRRQIFLRFDGEHAKALLAGANLLEGRDHWDTTLVVQHVAPHCESREYFKSVLDGEATGVYQGKVIVAPGAQKTDGAMKSHAILLSDGATMNNKPELEIFADDVVCGHGATVAQLDEDQLFYAQARGLPKHDAEAMLLEAFVDEATDRIDNEFIRAHVAGLIGEWLAARRRA
jgi:Fe-S cluster assembly protein SufD